MTRTREAPIAVEIRGGHIVPADAWAVEEVAKLPNGARFNCYFTLAKSDPDDAHGRLLALYHAGIPELYDYLPCTGPGTNFPTPRHVKEEILKQIGFCDRIPQRDGTERKIPLSMARDRMTYEDLQFCLELSQLYVAAWTMAETGEAFDPWDHYKKTHPKVGR